jgi:hypothetical protein
MLSSTSPEADAAIISASVSMLMFILTAFTKPFWEKHIHNYKLKADHEYEQKKKIKEIIATHKIKLLDSAEHLNNRLWNFSSNISSGWHHKNPDSSIEQYYLPSFAYRFTCFFAYCRKIEKEMVFLDSTISAKEDLVFIKYIKLFLQLFCDSSLMQGSNYNHEHDADHFFKDDFLSLLDLMTKDNGIKSFNEFKSDKVHFTKIYSYIDEISDNSSCRKWYTIQIFHFLLMSFMNTYGYDYQYTEKNKMGNLSRSKGMNIFIKNIEPIIKRYSLNSDKNIRMSITALKNA